MAPILLNVFFGQPGFGGGHVYLDCHFHYGLGQSANIRHEMTGCVELHGLSRSSQLVSSLHGFHGKLAHRPPIWPYRTCWPDVGSVMEWAFV